MVDHFAAQVGQTGLKSSRCSTRWSFLHPMQLTRSGASCTIVDGPSTLCFMDGSSPPGRSLSLNPWREFRPLPGCHVFSIDPEFCAGVVAWGVREDPSVGDRTPGEWTARWRSRDPTCIARITATGVSDRAPGALRRRVPWKSTGSETGFSGVP